MALTPKKARELLAQIRERLKAEAAQAFVDAIESMAGAIDLKALNSLIEAGRIDEAVRMVTDLRAVLFPFNDVVRNAYVQGGLFAASAVPLLRNPLNGNRFAFVFDGHHARAVAWAQDQAAKLITNIQEDARAVAKSVIVEGLQDARPVASIGRDLVGRLNQVTRKREGGIIGLTSPQTDLAMKTRAGLYSGEKSAIRHYKTLQSRDKRFDAWADAALDGKKLSRDQIEAMLDGQKSKMLRQRGETVSRNEIFSAQAAGQHEGWAQLRESGAVKATDIQKRWQHNHNNPLRKDHLALNGTVVTFDQPFVLADGTRMQHDHDQAGGPKQNLGCHCTTFYRLRKGRGSDG